MTNYPFRVKCVILVSEADMEMLTTTEGGDSKGKRNISDKRELIRLTKAEQEDILWARGRQIALKCDLRERGKNLFAVPRGPFRSWEKVEHLFQTWDDYCEGEVHLTVDFRRGGDIQDTEIKDKDTGKVIRTIHHYQPKDNKVIWQDMRNFACVSIDTKAKKLWVTRYETNAQANGEALVRVYRLGTINFPPDLAALFVLKRDCWSQERLRETIEKALTSEPANVRSSLWVFTTAMACVVRAYFDAPWDLNPEAKKEAPAPKPEATAPVPKPTAPQETPKEEPEHVAVDADLGLDTTATETKPEAGDDLWQNPGDPTDSEQTLWQEATGTDGTAASNPNDPDDVAGQQAGIGTPPPGKNRRGNGKKK